MTPKPRERQRHNCNIIGCENSDFGLICSMHRARFRRTGSYELEPRVKAASIKIDAMMIREAFDYDPNTGILFNKVDRKRAKAGKPAGDLNDNGYLRVCFNDRRYYVQRVIWLHAYGEWPHGDVDHINGLKTDNRLANLRDVPRSINALNRHVSSAASGIVGAHAAAGKFQCVVKLNGQRTYLGKFTTPEQAGAVRKAALADPSAALALAAEKRALRPRRKTLSPEDVAEIRSSTGMQRDVAARLGISESMVSLIRSGKRHMTTR